MRHYKIILFILIFFSGCSLLERSEEHLNCSNKIYFNQNYLNKNYIGMTKKQIIYMFGIPIISDSFEDVYHYYFCNETDRNVFHKIILSLYFQGNKVISFKFDEI
ncbi:outer membrane assembly protein BamE [Buchnera aphidicola (Diuraphis noxia)]|uniref:Outer membrane protein assembly factor BamE n=1 Tax=Buchnera aphidicola subsp. Diuraphis noxia TaxID=118101 RepID=A0A1B2H8J8_BUCDN|nr:outer membrane protein assembly factor BamE [Buchnera aphidicola]ANZ22416.1 outer membrane assembly protein BamE [Buchnera aphidicola (Diuraphis noxia)]